MVAAKGSQAVPAPSVRIDDVAARVTGATPTTPTTTGPDDEEFTITRRELTVYIEQELAKRLQGEGLRKREEVATQAWAADWTVSPIQALDWAFESRDDTTLQTVRYLLGVGKDPHKREVAEPVVAEPAIAAGKEGDKVAKRDVATKKSLKSIVDAAKGREKGKKSA